MVFKVITRKQLKRLIEKGVKIHINGLISPTGLECQAPIIFENGVSRQVGLMETLDLPDDKWVYLALTQGVKTRSSCLAKNLKYEVEIEEGEE